MTARSAERDNVHCWPPAPGVVVVLLIWRSPNPAEAAGDRAGDDSRR